MWPTSTAFFDLQRAAAVGTGVARRHLPQIFELRLEIFAGRDVAQVIVVLIGAGDHVAAALQCIVGQDRHILHAHRSQRSGIGAEPFLDLFGRAGRNSGSPATLPNLVSLN